MYLAKLDCIKQTGQSTNSTQQVMLLLGQNVIHSCSGIYDISRQVMFEYMQIRVIGPDQAMCEVEGRSNERALADNWCWRMLTPWEPSCWSTWHWQWWGSLRTRMREWECLHILHDRKALIKCEFKILRAKMVERKALSLLITRSCSLGHFTSLGCTLYIVQSNNAEPDPKSIE